MYVVAEEYDAALEIYSRVIDGVYDTDTSVLGDEDRCVLLCKRSAVKVQCGDAKGAVEDADTAADLRPDCVNAYFRKGYDTL